MADIFISYAREDRGFAERIARGLNGLGLEVFWDTEIPPGQTWADYIEGKLTQCRAVIVLWSQHSTKSQWVREEARMGREKAKLIPVLLDGTPAPFGFGEVQAADLSAWTGDQNHPDWVRFSRAVYATARGADAPLPPPAAPQPQAAWSAPPPAAAPAWSDPRAAASSAESGAPENLSPIGYIQKCLRLYVNGNGRARRAEYWWWTLGVFVVSIVAYIIDVVLFGFNSYTSQPNTQAVSTILNLAVLAPGISVAARRFHDVGLSGWLVAGFFVAFLVGGGLSVAMPPLGGLILLVAGIGMLVILVLPSKPGANQYGPNPKGQ
ncbi:DUF805 domain-containing protein [Vitreimonas flagellata]|uniref:DUF805 domain-containing protein n=1 Tax=Vitreimonas flagellata TaxID=2560861 RepID=UPI00143158AE|nr:DUF805 domain-containing protein [Vitreimonas flagellata]